MALQTYKIPDGFNPGIYHTQERNGVMFTYQSGKVADLQRRLMSGFNFLSYLDKGYRTIEVWLSLASEKTDTTYAERQRDSRLAGLRSEWDEVVDLMVQILKAGAEPLPPDTDLDHGLSVALGTARLREAAIAAAGGEDAVEAFRVSAANFVSEEITRTSALLIADAEAFDLDQQQRAVQRSAEAQEKVNKEAHEFAQGPSAAVVRHPKLTERRQRAAQRSAEAQERSYTEANEFAQGPSAATVCRSKLTKRHKKDADHSYQEEVLNAEQKLSAKLKLAKEKCLGRP